jgi:hypothetical protein
MSEVNKEWTGAQIAGVMGRTTFQKTLHLLQGVSLEDMEVAVPNVKIGDAEDITTPEDGTLVVVVSHSFEDSDVTAQVRKIEKAMDERIAKIREQQRRVHTYPVVFVVFEFGDNFPQSRLHSGWRVFTCASSSYLS